MLAAAPPRRPVDRLVRALLAAGGCGAILLVAAVVAHADLAPADGAMFWLLVIPPLAVGLVLFLAARLATPETQRAVLLTLAAGVLALFAADIYAFHLERTLQDLDRDASRGPPPDGKAGAMLEQRPVPFMSALALLLDARAGLDESRFQGLLPLSGVSRAPTLLCRRAEGWLVYDSDEHGFVNPRGLWDTPRIDIAIVGDSFAQGVCVEPPRNIAGRLRERFPLTLNLGMGGNGPLSELGTIREYLAARRPRVVLWLFYEGNDITKDIQKEQQSPVLRGYLRPGHTQNLMIRRPEIDGQLRALVAQQAMREGDDMLSDASTLPPLLDVLLLRNIRHALGLGASRIGLAEFADVLSAAQAAVEGWGGTLIFVYLPGERRYTGLLPALEQDVQRRRVLDLVRSRHLPVVDIHEAFSRHKAPRTLFAGHYNEEGYALAASTIEAALAGRLPPR